MSSDLDYVDPGLSYLSTGWEIQYAVGCKLLNYPDTQGADGAFQFDVRLTLPPGIAIAHYKGWLRPAR